jgi:hyperpolarization activated cyclic nucleotide-gated potassium channel 2
MIPDFVSFFPFDMLNGPPSDDQSSGGGYNKLVRLVRLPRLYRLLRISKVFKILKENKNSKVWQRLDEFFSLKQSFVRLFGVLISILTATHIVACLWFFLARLDAFNKDTWVYRMGFLDKDMGEMYLYSLYWAITTLTTVGYGDITAYSPSEKVFSIVWMFFGLFFIAFSVSSASSMLGRVVSKD